MGIIRAEHFSSAAADINESINPDAEGVRGMELWLELAPVAVLIEQSFGGTTTELLSSTNGSGSLSASGWIQFPVIGSDVTVQVTGGGPRRMAWRLHDETLQPKGRIQLHSSSIVGLAAAASTGALGPDLYGPFVSSITAFATLDQNFDVGLEIETGGITWTGNAVGGLPANQLFTLIRATAPERLALDITNNGGVAAAGTVAIVATLG